MKALLIFHILMTVPLIIGRKFKIRRLAAVDDWLDGGKFISVFGLNVIAQPTICNKNLQYAANILAQMLDGNEDGLPDDKRIVTQMQRHKSALLIFGSKVNTKDLGNLSYSFKTLETNTCNNHINKKNTMLAVSRLIAAFGLSPAYPRTLGVDQPSILRRRLSLIVGGCENAHGATMRRPGCKNHGFHNGSTCDMSCMATEYLAQLMTVSLGIFPSTAEASTRFWDVESKDDLIAKDPGGFQLMKLILHKLPPKAPNGNYRPGRNGYRMACVFYKQCKPSRMKGKIIELKI